MALIMLQGCKSNAFAASQLPAYLPTVSPVLRSTWYIYPLNTGESFPLLPYIGFLSPFISLQSTFIRCCWFCAGVHHSRFSMQLLHLFPSLWLICNLLWFLGTSLKYAITSLCIAIVLRPKIKAIETCIYPLFWLILHILPSFLTCPLLLTSYRPIVASTVFQISAIIFFLEKIAKKQRLHNPTDNYFNGLFIHPFIP